MTNQDEPKAVGEDTPMIDKNDDNSSTYSGVATERTYDLSTAGEKKLRVATDNDDDQKMPDSPTPPETPTSVFSDAPSETTYGRRIARKFSDSRCCGQMYDKSKFKSTIIIEGNEEEGKPLRRIEPPKLDKGWEFFEHYVLPRCYADRQESSASQGSGRKYVRAPSGEDTEKTILYPIWGTPMGDMGDFGIGVGMYFHMVRFFAVASLIAGFLSTPLMTFYSNDYSTRGKQGLNNGSAICTSTSWQPCPDCKLSDLDTWPIKVDSPKRIIEGLSPDGENKVTFIMKNDCDVNETFSIMNLTTMFFFAAATLLFIFLQRKIRARLDEGEQTTSDYSIRVKVSQSKLYL